ncbi:BnaCnng35220D [Brassica napus]|uniref:BnaCnng35220D protein n=1 Tax=Brassica napus TaxID=3708 RepID=A0A078J7V5_BRANA|nr:BnaCnng35220D [Brassica napus]
MRSESDSVLGVFCNCS